MRYRHMGAGIGLALGALGLQIPAAAASDDSDVRIDPWNAYPGSTVTVSTRACDPDADYGKGWSRVGGEFHLFEGDQEGVLTGQFQIPEATRPGSDTVTLKCPPLTKVTETYQVTGRPPRGSVSAGFGLADDTGTGLALGGGLLVTAAAGGVVWMCRRPNVNRP
ncbi:sortase [Streptomyces sp. TRM72054]|uniref:sortase n=1 Tax=Streptomyces sp. TRM72054 TaxID=2870562 RepID=UPI001C8CA470|nr:sortase [Streptomyces sp. TRM72054]MBX9394627.1 sortase [Streptomyces sp. TRM72054]